MKTTFEPKRQTKLVVIFIEWQIYLFFCKCVQHLGHFLEKKFVKTLKKILFEPKRRKNKTYIIYFHIFSFDY